MKVIKVFFLYYINNYIYLPKHFRFKKCILSIFSPAFRKCVRRSLANLKYDTEHFYKRFDAQESLLEKILAKLNSQESKGSAIMVYNDYDDVDLGVIDNDEDLNNMEEKLINDKPYRNVVV